MMRSDDPVAYIAVAVLGVIGLSALALSLFENGAGPEISTAAELATFLGFLLVLVIAVLALARRRA